MDTEKLDENYEKVSWPKYGKAATLADAHEYIKHLENTEKRLGDSVDSMKLRVGAFEKLALSGSIAVNKRTFVSEPLLNTETLESIQVDFQNIKPSRKSSLSSPVARKRSSKQDKDL
ncbi:uncharacterized protein RAG0_14763 [Rhynchosporium agropyri]|uniref:Uncharacterized protein n=1 Tax=Rhynchosporium agropyri TaxID=914238 RepID=A0A1E1LI74_9HELO|nr:uncharacterized protein RAG0_14763 [Rhynchosporium agropyri]